VDGALIFLALALIAVGIGILDEYLKRRISKRREK